MAVNPINPRPRSSMVVGSGTVVEIGTPSLLVKLSKTYATNITNGIYCIFNNIGGTEDF
jgi:hypothetical protein